MERGSSSSLLLLPLQPPFHSSIREHVDVCSSSSIYDYKIVLVVVVAFIFTFQKVISRRLVFYFSASVEEKRIDGLAAKEEANRLQKQISSFFNTLNTIII